MVVEVSVVGDVEEIHAIRKKKEFTSNIAI